MPTPLARARKRRELVNAATTAGLDIENLIRRARVARRRHRRLALLARSWCPLPSRARENAESWLTRLSRRFCQTTGPERPGRDALWLKSNGPFRML